MSEQTHPRRAVMSLTNPLTITLNDVEYILDSFSYQLPDPQFFVLVMRDGLPLYYHVVSYQTGLDSAELHSKLDTAAPVAIVDRLGTVYHSW